MKEGKPPVRSVADAIGSIRDQIVRQFGEDSAIIPAKDALNEISGKVRIWIPTGMPELDRVLGREGHGIPCGKVIEVYGPEGQGKSTLSYFIIGATQRAGGVAGLIDSEHSYDDEWAPIFGVKNDELILLPLLEDSCLEGFFEIMVSTMRKTRKISKKCPLLFVLDTAYMTRTQEQMQSKSFLDGGHRFASLARSMSQHLPSLQTQLSKHDATLLLINQVRDNVGVKFGEKYITPGGHAIKHACAVRAIVSRRGKDAKSGAITTAVTNIKNKVGVAYNSVSLELHPKKGLSLAKKRKDDDGD